MAATPVRGDAVSTGRRAGRFEIAARIALIAAAISLLVFAAVGGEERQSPVRLWLGSSLVVTTILAVVVIALAARRQPWRWPWLVCFALSVTAFGLGALRVFYAGLPHPTDPATVVYMVSVSALLGFVTFDVYMSHRPNWVRTVEFAAIVGGGLCLASMPRQIYVVHPVEFWRDVAGFAIAVRTLVDLGVPAMVLYQMRRGYRVRNRSSWLLLIGSVGLAVVDLTYRVRVLADLPVDAAVLLTGYVITLGTILVGACGYTPYPQTSGRREPTSALVFVGAIAIVALALGAPSGDGSVTTILGTITFSAVLFRMVIALRQARLAASAVQLARTDELTHLLNRRALLFHLDQMIDRGQRFSLLLMDLDKFKEINDTLGHLAGDTALVEVARRLSSVVAGDDLVARLGGDEFAVLTRRCEEQTLRQTVEKIRKQLSQPIDIDRHQVSVGVSIGVASNTSANATTSEIIRKADIAMYRAKFNSQVVAYYNDATDESAHSFLQLSQRLREDLHRGDVEIRYVGQLDVASGQIVSVQAMVCWRQPSGAIWAEDRVLSLARNAGLVPQLLKFVIDRVRRDGTPWLRDGLVQRVGIAWDAQELLSRPLRKLLFAAVDADPIIRDRLMIQVTEESFLTDEQKVRAGIAELRSHHIQVSIDKYGVGFSPLSLLGELAVQELRIDPSFISAIDQDQRCQMIVRSTAKLAQSLGLRLVAPNVDAPEIMAELVRLGVPLLQGAAILPEMSAATFRYWVDGENWSDQMADLVGGHPMAQSPVQES